MQIVCTADHICKCVNFYYNASRRKTSNFPRTGHAYLHCASLRVLLSLISSHPLSRKISTYVSRREIAARPSGKTFPRRTLSGAFPRSARERERERASPSTFVLSPGVFRDHDGKKSFWAYIHSGRDARELPFLALPRSRPPALAFSVSRVSHPSFSRSTAALSFRFTLARRSPQYTLPRPPSARTLPRSFSLPLSVRARSTLFLRSSTPDHRRSAFIEPLRAHR